MDLCQYFPILRWVQASQQSSLAVYGCYYFYLSLIHRRFMYYYVYIKE